MTQTMRVGNTLLNRLLRGEARLHELIDMPEFAGAMVTAREAVIQAFMSAQTGKGRRKATPGYMLGLDENMSSLARFVHDHLGKDARTRVFSPAGLTEAVRSWDIRHKETAADIVRREIIMRVLITMKGAHEVYYMADGSWNMYQSVMDGLDEIEAATRSYQENGGFHRFPQQATRKRVLVR
ncbi:MAG: hypothetical protein HZB75_01270 [Candidatus Saccharibacteria bacterium]|nr:MAG: hypothetical protein HZB75_01270 [Candidatus Saccharibacteria bacterium]